MAYSGRPSLPPVRLERRQACADCGAELERGGREALYFAPEGETVFSLPGQRTIGPDLAFRQDLNRSAIGCSDEALSWGTVTPLGSVLVTNSSELGFDLFLHVSGRMYEALQELADQEQTTMADVMRAAISRHIANPHSGISQIAS